MDVSNNSATNISTLSPLEKAFVNYDIQLPYNVVLYVVLVVFMLLSNGGTMWVLYKSKEVFKSNNYKLMFHMALVITVQAIYICINNGILRIIFTIRRITDYETILSCALRQLPYEATMAVDQFNILIIALDRLHAVVAPFYYKSINLSKKYLALCVLFPWVWAFGESITKLSLYTIGKANEIALFCVMSVTRTPEFAKYVGIRAMITASLTLAVYAITLIVCKVKLTNCQGNVSVLKSQLGLRLMKTCLIDALVYTGTYFVGQVYYNVVLAYVKGDSLIVLGPMAVTFQLLATVPRFIINLYFNSDIKTWFQKKLDLKSTKVSHFFTSNAEHSRKKLTSTM